jgi:hypothetical protein
MTDRPETTLQTAAQGVSARADRPEAQDIRGRTTTSSDRSVHRRHAWLYEDLLA